MNKTLLAFLVFGLVAVALASDSHTQPAEGHSETADGSEAVGPANVKLQFHAPAQYPVQYPFYGYPYGGFPSQYYGGYGFNPYAGVASHPGFQAFVPHPAAAFHPAFAAPFYGGFTEEEADIEDESDNHDEHDEETASNPWAEAQSNWENYFSGPTSEFQWPGAEEARPGVHPTLGGTLNPWSPLGAPTHPYPFPMHQGLKNGPNHPRPFTPLGQYYPGSTGLPFAPQFAMGGFNPFYGGFGQPTYFPAAQNGDMSEEAAAAAGSAHAAPAAEAHH